MLSLYRIPPSSNANYTRKQKTPNTSPDDVKMTPNDFEMNSNEPVKPKKSKLKGGANIEINDKQIDEILHTNNL